MNDSPYKPNRLRPVLPDYVKHMKNDSVFLAKDIDEIFGYKKDKNNNCQHSALKLVKSGYLPEPKKFLVNTRCGYRLVWTKLEIIEAINKYNKEFFGE